MVDLLVYTRFMKRKVFDTSLLYVPKYHFIDKVVRIVFIDTIFLLI